MSAPERVGGKQRRARDLDASSDEPARASERGRAPGIASAGNLAAQRAQGPRGEPLAVTRGGRTTFSPEVATHPDRARIAAHEQVHRAQAASAAPRGDRRALERDAHVGTERLLRGEAHTPRVSAPPAMALGYEPTDLFPNLGTQADTEASALTREGLTDPQNRIGLQSGATQDETAGTAHAHYEVRVGASGGRGAIQSDTVVDLDYQRDRRMTVVGQPVIQISPEMGLGPTRDVPAMPFRLTYSRTIVYRDDHGRSANVEIDGVVFFSAETWAARRRDGFEPSYEALLNLEGDSGYMTVSIDGNVPVTPYFSNFSGNGRSLSGQARGAATGLASAPLSFIDTTVPATFVDPRESAGDQFASLHRYLSEADAAELARRLAQAAENEPSWLDDFADLLGDAASAILTPLIELGEAVSNAIGEWWDSLSPAARGILTAVGKAVAMIAGCFALAGIIVLLSPVELTVGAVMLAIGVVALAGSFLWALGNRISEAWHSDDRLRVLDAPMAALFDAIGLGGIIQALTNESLLTGQPLNMGEEERWETGTSGVIQLVGTFFMARGAMRGGAAPGEVVTPEVRGNMTDFNALPPERLPVLPDGHSWVRQGGAWTIERAPGAPEVPLEISIYSDGQGRINFNIRSGDRVLQSDAMTRPQGNTFPSGRENRLPPDLRGTGADNPYREPGPNGRLFQKGHGVDYADRLEGQGVRSSNQDPANFTPQARYWNSFLRNQLVQAIRGRGGGYREMPIYDANPPRTVNNTPIPREFIFVETTATGEPVTAWRIANDPNLTGTTLNDLPQPLPTSQIPSAMIGPGGRMVPPGTMFGPTVIGGQRGPDEDTPLTVEVGPGAP